MFDTTAQRKPVNCVYQQDKIPPFLFSFAVTNFHVFLKYWTVSHEVGGIIFPAEGAWTLRLDSLLDFGFCFSDTSCFFFPVLVATDFDWVNFGSYLSLRFVTHTEVSVVRF